MKARGNRRRIVAFTGIRSEYDLQYSIARELSRNPDIDFSFIVFGAHLSPLFGHTVEIIERDGFKIRDRIPSLVENDSPLGKAESAAILMNGICDAFERELPDLVIVCGDREETIVAATVATYANVPICHLFGGDKTFPEGVGDVDEQVRHATTKLAHLHFVTHDEHKERIIKMGEEPWRVNNFGSPALDKYLAAGNHGLGALKTYFGREDIVERQYCVLIHHPLPSNLEDSVLEIVNMLKALGQAGLQVFISYPNSDPGHQRIVEIIESWASTHPECIPYRNLPRDLFDPLIMNARFLIGNSSMGILEAPFLGLPAINVGKRQQERLNAGNVLFTSLKEEAIRDSIQKVLHDSAFSLRLQEGKYFYGNGHSGEKIARYLSDVPIDNALLAKRITY